MELPICILHKPTWAETKDIYNHLTTYTKGSLQTKGAHIFSLFKKYDFRFKCDNGKTEIPPIIATFMKSKTQPKENWVRLLALFYDPHNLNLIFENMSEREIEVWREVLRNHYLIDSEMEKIMGEKCFLRSKYYYASDELKEPFNFYFREMRCKANAMRNSSYRDYANFVAIDILGLQPLFKKFFPDQATIRSVDTLPVDDQLVHYDQECTIFAKLPILSSLYDGKLLPHKEGKLTATETNKAQKLVNFPDFFKTYPNNKQSCLSASLLLNFYVGFRQCMGRKKLPKEPELLLRELYHQTFETSSFGDFTFPVLLPHIKGIKKQKVSTYNCWHTTYLLTNLLKEHHADKWIRTDQLIMAIRSQSDEAESYFVHGPLSYYDDMDLRNGFIEDKNQYCYIHPGNIVRQLSEPFVKALLFSFSTLGMVELAYREPQVGDASPFDGLQYVHLTELGKYVLKITDNYEPQFTNDEAPAFELDDQRLLIKVLRNDSPFVQLLANFADGITPSLYSVSYESFLSGCSTYHDVEQKVKMFKQYICKNQPQVWKQFMGDVAKRCNPFGVPEDNYVLITIPPDATDLQRLVLTVPSIRQYVLKAENYMLLVKEDDLDKLSAAMKKYGYLV
jgi:hypothetical protein